ncbi:MAG: peroxiredoxin family protein [candidate division KSB1 bacterium]|nr:peroxiredoxin family protein [candidate division KSB1 bacterium]MDZ7367475.1 peroxiredoxin family protein [candidate division KSB1 bacterium]
MKRPDFIYLAFLVIIGLLGWKVKDLKKTNTELIHSLENLKRDQDSLITGAQLFAHQNDFCGKIVPKFSLPYIEGHNAFSFPGKGNNTYYLLIFFTPQDCPVCFVEIAFWDKLQTKFKDRLTVLAIGTANSCEILRHFAKANGISIPILCDQEGLLFKALRLTDSGLTPLKILTTSKGIILHAAQMIGSDLAEQDKYFKLLNDAIP